MLELTPEQSCAVRQQPGGSLTLCDPETRQEYVLVPSEVFARLVSIADDGLDMRQVGTLVELAMREDDAGDPLLQSYQKYRQP